MKPPGSTCSPPAQIYAPRRLRSRHLHLHCASPTPRSCLHPARHQFGLSRRYGRPTASSHGRAEEGCEAEPPGCGKPQQAGAGEAPWRRRRCRSRRRHRCRSELKTQPLLPCRAVRAPKEPQDEIMRHTVQAKASGHICRSAVLCCSVKGVLFTSCPLPNMLSFRRLAWTSTTHPPQMHTRSRCPACSRQMVSVEQPLAEATGGGSSSGAGTRAQHSVGGHGSDGDRTVAACAQRASCALAHCRLGGALDAGC